MTRKADDWETHARKELAPGIAGSAFVITINPSGEIDPKIALETGYAVLMGKPIVLLVNVGETALPGLRRIAHRVIELTAPLSTDAGTQQLMAALGALKLGGSA